MENRGLAVFMYLTLLFVASMEAVTAAAAGGLQEQCSNNFAKVAPCVNFATGQAAAPSKECCAAVAEIKGSQPVCLCYVIQQVHDGNEQVKSLGLQEAKLLQLPSACKMSDSSLSVCPKLLNIPPSSPDYAIFSNSSAAPAVTTPSKPSGTNTSPKDDTSGSSKHLPLISGVFAMSTVAIFFLLFISI